MNRVYTKSNDILDYYPDFDMSFGSEWIHADAWYSASKQITPMIGLYYGTPVACIHVNRTIFVIKGIDE